MFTSLMTMFTSKISKKGQIVIPKEIREKLKIAPGETLIISQVDDRIFIDKESNQPLPKMVDILKLGKPFPPNLVQSLREEWA
jgi:AbrB family looped-hinge helix DNA binding protein